MRRQPHIGPDKVGAERGEGGLPHVVGSSPSSDDLSKPSPQSPMG